MCIFKTDQKYFFYQKVHWIELMCDEKKIVPSSMLLSVKKCIPIIRFNFILHIHLLVCVHKKATSIMTVSIYLNEDRFIHI